MPLYLVRWPGLSASLVSARDEDDLLDTLDQAADSEGATWSVYRGPVWIDFDVPATYRIDEKAADEPLRADEIVAEDVKKVEIGALKISSSSCDHTSDMNERVTKTAFPQLHRWVGDTTELVTGNGKLFLAVILTCYSKYVVGCRSRR